MSQFLDALSLSTAGSSTIKVRHSKEYIRYTSLTIFPLGVSTLTTSFPDINSLTLTLPNGRWVLLLSLAQLPQFLQTRIYLRYVRQNFWTLLNTQPEIADLTSLDLLTVKWILILLSKPQPTCSFKNIAGVMAAKSLPSDKTSQRPWGSPSHTTVIKFSKSGHPQKYSKHSLHNIHWSLTN